MCLVRLSAVPRSRIVFANPSSAPRSASGLAAQSNSDDGTPHRSHSITRREDDPFAFLTHNTQQVLWLHCVLPLEGQWPWRLLWSGAESPAAFGPLSICHLLCATPAGRSSAGGSPCGALHHGHGFQHGLTLSRLLPFMVVVARNPTRRSNDVKFWSTRI